MDKTSKRPVAGDNMEPAIKKFLGDVLKAMDMEAEVKAVSYTHLSYPQIVDKLWISLLINVINLLILSTKSLFKGCLLYTSLK